MPIQDAHTHFFGRPFFDGLAALSPRKDEAGLVEAVAAKAMSMEIAANVRSMLKEELKKVLPELAG